MKNVHEWTKHYLERRPSWGKSCVASGGLQIRPQSWYLRDMGEDAKELVDVELLIR